jgi:hypothetical protein
MPKYQQIRVPRQRPVSCRFCRSRKLRCNRDSPCSNCISRGVTCELENAVRLPPVTPSSYESEILERIKKLELLVENQRVDKHETVKTHHPGLGTPLRQMKSPTVSSETETLDNDISYLESIYSNRELLVIFLVCSSRASSDDSQQHEILSNKLVFQNCPITQIPDAPAYIHHSTTSYEPLRCIWMPQYSEAKILFEKYVQDIDHVHHIVHTPSLLDMLSKAYVCLSVPGSVTKDTGGLIFLLLGIFASATNSWTYPDCDHGLFSVGAEANVQASLWVKALEDALDTAHRTIGVSIEGIQGVTIAAFVVLNISRFSRRCKALF